uniref:Putative ovule protein n=1 Tax=Solanum chacoense TaxID=4108 RepID=A0A0V0I6Q0_SOLCH
MSDLPGSCPVRSFHLRNSPLSPSLSIKIPPHSNNFFPDYDSCFGVFRLRQIFSLFFYTASTLVRSTT